MLRICLASSSRMALPASSTRIGCRMLVRSAAATKSLDTINTTHTLPSLTRTIHATYAARLSSQSSSPTSAPDSNQGEDAAAAADEAAQEPRLSLTFTCAVQDCNHRSTHSFTKRSYQHGIVLVQCPNCKNRHLIADNLSWFTETDEEPKNVEQMIAAKGGRIRKGVQYVDGKDYETIEIYSDEGGEKRVEKK